MNRRGYTSASYSTRDPWSSQYYGPMKILDYWDMSNLFDRKNETVTAVASSESLRNDDELNQMVARVVCDPAQDKLEDDALNKGQDAERTKLSFDAECEMLKSLLRKSQVSSEDEFVGSVSAFYRRDASSSTTPPPLPPPPGFTLTDASSSAVVSPARCTSSGAQAQINGIESRPSPKVAAEKTIEMDSMDDSDTLIVLPDDRSNSAGPTQESFVNPSELNSLASSQVQLFAGAPLFAFPAPPRVPSNFGQSIYDDFRRNGQDVPTPVWGGAGSVAASFRSFDDGSSGAVTPCHASDRSAATTPNRAASAVAASETGSENGSRNGAIQEASGVNGVYINDNSNKSNQSAFSWASVTKAVAGAPLTKKPDSAKVNLLAEQRLCRILEKFIEVFSCTYDEARSLLELMQAKYDLLTSTPMEVIITAARDLLKSTTEREKVTGNIVTTPPVSATSILQQHPAQPVPNSQQQQQAHPPLSKEEDLPWNYKTVMCNFHKDGMCRLGSKCMFAHSKAELREPFIPNGFCIAFVTKGVCKWGSSCNYIHEAPALSKKQVQSSDKLKLIKAPTEVSSKPRVPVGLNFEPKAPTSQSVASTKGGSSSSSVAASAISASVAVPTAAPAHAESEPGTKCKNKNKKDKDDDDEWSTVSKGAKPSRVPEFRSPAALVAAFQIDSLCVLCRDQVSQSNNRITLECGHSQFHRGCIKDWLRCRSPATCPVCKSVSNLDPEDTPNDALASSKKKK